MKLLLNMLGIPLSRRPSVDVLQDCDAMDKEYAIIDHNVKELQGHQKVLITYTMKQ
jgi:hypothetical protein